MNIYEMYVANGNKAGFWVVRDSWGQSFAKVLTVAGFPAGPLSGDPPYYAQGPKKKSPTVMARIYYRDQKPVIEPLRCPGTYAYRRIVSPFGVADSNLGKGL